VVLDSICWRCAFFFSSRRRHTRCYRDWSSDVCSSDLELPKGEKSIVRWELTPDGEGTILRITHKRLTRPTAIGFTSGIHAFLDRLEDELDDVPLVDWRTRVDEVRANYPGREARR